MMLYVDSSPESKQAQELIFNGGFIRYVTVRSASGPHLPQLVVDNVAFVGLTSIRDCVKRRLELKVGLRANT